MGILVVLFTRSISLISRRSTRRGFRADLYTVYAKSGQNLNDLLSQASDGDDKEWVDRVFDPSFRKILNVDTASGESKEEDVIDIPTSSQPFSATSTIDSLEDSMGMGLETLNRLTDLGYNPDAIQSIKPRVIEMILERSVAYPKRGLPKSWLLTDTVDIITDSDNTSRMNSKHLRSSKNKYSSSPPREQRRSGRGEREKAPRSVFINDINVRSFNGLSESFAWRNPVPGKIDGKLGEEVFAGDSAMEVAAKVDTMSITGADSDVRVSEREEKGKYDRYQQENDDGEDYDYDYDYGENDYDNDDESFIADDYEPYDDEERSNNEGGRNYATNTVSGDRYNNYEMNRPYYSRDRTGGRYDSYMDEDEGDDSRVTYDTEESLVDVGANSVQPFWPSSNEFQDMLLDESLWRINLIGKWVTPFVKEETRWRNDLYKKWIRFLDDGLGSSFDVSTDIDSFGSPLPFRNNYRVDNSFNNARYSDYVTRRDIHDDYEEEEEEESYADDGGDYYDDYYEEEENSFYEPNSQATRADTSTSSISASATSDTASASTIQDELRGNARKQMEYGFSKGTIYRDYGWDVEEIGQDRGVSSRRGMPPVRRRRVSQEEEDAMLRSDLKREMNRGTYSYENEYAPRNRKRVNGNRYYDNDDIYSNPRERGYDDYDTFNYDEATERERVRLAAAENYERDLSSRISQSMATEADTWSDVRNEEAKATKGAQRGLKELGNIARSSVPGRALTALEREAMLMDKRARRQSQREMRYREYDEYDDRYGQYEDRVMRRRDEPVVSKGAYFEDTPRRLVRRKENDKYASRPRYPSLSSARSDNRNRNERRGFPQGRRGVRSVGDSSYGTPIGSEEEWQEAWENSANRKDSEDASRMTTSPVQSSAREDKQEQEQVVNPPAKRSWGNGPMGAAEDKGKDL